eukprot:CAMPEP_0184482860 /NCGR_PEP_ID=MMETSP0113_2-20130426/4455_1 /TAXON_ID=91329 /ORGANISM="Norrisiella sphaerica, Strain BC52" /LENGTH=52 /DNA_ID=CAMNT_0026862869 /DNA_START=559 /DNA_END=717 /DNA_ORIENTATION=-
MFITAAFRIIKKAIPTEPATTHFVDFPKTASVVGTEWFSFGEGGRSCNKPRD